MVSERRMSDIYREYLRGDVSFESMIEESERRIAAMGLDREPQPLPPRPREEPPRR